LIDSNAAAEQFESLILEEVTAAPESDRFITVDTEFIREKLEKPLLCLVQIATPLNVFIIDAVAIDVGFLQPIFVSPLLLKVLHSARQDLEILYQYSIMIENFRDTQLQEMILSNNPAMSYQLMVSKYLEIDLNKDHTLSNWKNRPLTPEQLSYAATDVIHLRDIYKMQWQELIRLNRNDWLCDELSQMQPQHSPIKIISTELGPTSSMRHQLLEWRKQRAQTLGIKKEAVASTRFINTILKKGRKFVAAMKNSRQISDKNVLDFLKFAETFFECTPSITKTANATLFHAIRSLLEICAKKNNVTPQIVATSADLEKLVCEILPTTALETVVTTMPTRLDLCEIKCLHGWRRKIFGDVLLEFLNGNISIVAHSSDVSICRT
jgi:ribonuclease D